MKSGNVLKALNIINSYRSGDDWLPEAMMLLNTGKFSKQQRESAVASLMQHMPLHKIHPSTKFPDYICTLFGAIGRMGYSFPEWRFTAQGFGDQGSLMERYGMTRLKRDNDLHDPSLPPGHPDRDQYGTGFALEKDGLYIEYRRAYILCYDLKTETSLVVRNNSFFFGRDRLPEPAYVSWDKHLVEELQAFDKASFARGESFLPLQNVFDDFAGNNYALGSRSRKLINLVEDFYWQNELLSHWIFGPEGRPHLKEFMNHLLTRQEASGKGATPPFHICRIDRESAPWSVNASAPASRSTLAELDTINFHSLNHYVLLSGPDGDFPIRPDTKPTSLQSGSHPSVPDCP